MGYFLREKCVYLWDVGLNLFALTATRHRTRLPLFLEWHGSFSVYVFKCSWTQF